MNYSHKDISLYLSSIEKSYDVNSLKYDDIHLWPLMRILISNIMFSSGKLSSKNDLLPKKRLSKIEYVMQLLIHKISVFKNYSFKYENIYIIRSNEARPNIISNTKYPFFTSLKKLFSEINKNIDYLDMSDLRYKRYLNFFKTNINFKKTKLKEVEKFLYQTDIYDKLGLDIDHVLESLLEVIAHQKTLKLILPSNVKRIFYTVFYDFGCLGANLYSSKYKITTCEIQHGQQGKWSPFNQNLSIVPRSGYKLQPLILWLWGEVSLKRKQSFNANKNHKSFVGGHPLYFYEKFYERKAEVRKKRKVLFAAQPIPPIIPKLIYDLIEKKSEKFDFYIRLHPVDLDKILEVEKTFKDNESVFLENPTKKPLYEVLGNVDFVLTRWSSVVYEAVVMEAKGIIIDPIGKELMEESILDGEIFFAGNVEEVSEALEQFQYSTQKKIFIETDLEKCLFNIKKYIFGEESE